MPKSSLENQLSEFQQQHLIRFWDELSADQQSALTAQIEKIDFAQVQKLFNEKHAGDEWESLAKRADVPPAITLEDFKNPQSYQQAYDLGADEISGGRTAMILTAGGQGSRLGFDHPKGMFPIGPVSDRTLFQIVFEHVMARARQFETRIPIYIMTSPPTHAETEEFLKAQNYFGFNPEDLHIFCQGVMPAVDSEGRVVLGEKGRLFESPDGHGGMLAALVKSGCLADMVQRGVETVFYGQIDNPLIQVCNPALIGYHLQNGSEMTTQVVRKSAPLQKVGNVVSVDGQVQIIEYSDLPETYAKQTNDDGSLKLWAGSIAVHVFSAAFLNRTSSQADALPFHRANKKVPFVDDNGNMVQPEKPNAIKFERFIFDLLPWAKNAIVCEVDPAEGFCAVKNAAPAPSETPEHVRKAISDLHTSWLVEAGATVKPDTHVEINPMFAVDVAELKQKIQPGTEISEPTYFN